MEQADKEKYRWNYYNRPHAADQFRSSSSPHTVENNQPHQDSLCLHTTVSEKVHLYETVPRANDAVSDRGAVNVPKSRDENYCKINKAEKYTNDSGDDGDDRDVLASWERKNGHFRRHVVNTNRQRYQGSPSFHTIVFEPRRVPEAPSTRGILPFQPAVYDAPCSQPESAEKKFKENEEEKYDSACGDRDEPDDVFAAYVAKNDADFQQVLNGNSQLDRTSLSEAAPFSESFQTCYSPPSRPVDGHHTTNPPNEDREGDHVVRFEVEEEPLPDYDDDDDDDDDIFISWRKKSEDMRRGANGGCPNGHGIHWSGEGSRQNRKYQSVNMAAECDDDFQITSSISAPEIDDQSDINDVFASSGNGKCNGMLHLQRGIVLYLFTAREYENFTILMF